MGGPGELDRLPAFGFNWQPVKKKSIFKFRPDLGNARDYTTVANHDQMVISGPDYKLDVRLGMQAYELEKMLPRNLDMLMVIINDKSIPPEWRAKVLEVVILRGANNLSYAEMETLSGNKFLPSEDRAALKERMQYQLAAMTAVVQGPADLFDHLSRSRDQLPDGVSGRYPATEWMNTMLREGGLLSKYETRQQLVEPWLMKLEPEQRGQAMFHLRDAEGAKEIGKVAELTGFEISVGDVGFGLQWQGAKDTHWQVVGNDFLGPVEKQLTANPKQKEEFYNGYRLADRQLADPKPN